LTTPAWQAVVPRLVPKEEIGPAVAANSVGMNISRAVGPALGGGIATVLGIVAPFWINAVSNLGVIAALNCWKGDRTSTSALPVERLGGAISIGLRHARYNSDLRSTLVRAFAFFFFASGYWALLPLIARTGLGGAASDYGYLLAAIGFAAVLGALLLQESERRLGGDKVVVAGTVTTAFATALFGAPQHWIFIYLAAVVAGASWIAVVASLNVSAQVALPDWVRGRGLAIFGSVFFGALGAGSLFWGVIAEFAGLSVALGIAAGGLLIGIPLTRGWKLHTGARIDLTPSMHWPVPVTEAQLDYQRGPVLVTIEYAVEREHTVEFLRAAAKLGEQRKQDGAYAWGVFEDAQDQGRFIEAFLVDSWVEHMRQHSRVTVAARHLQDAIRNLLRKEPSVTHLVAAHPVPSQERQPGSVVHLAGQS